MVKPKETLGFPFLCSLVKIFWKLLGVHIHWVTHLKKKKVNYACLSLLYAFLALQLGRSQALRYLSTECEAL